MGTLALWEQLALGALALLVVLWFRPGIKAALARSRQAGSRDWAGALLPIALVVLFVLFLITALR